jgi:hypothetical protein
MSAAYTHLVAVAVERGFATAVVIAEQTSTPTADVERALLRLARAGRVRCVSKALVAYRPIAPALKVKGRRRGNRGRLRGRHNNRR